MERVLTSSQMKNADKYTIEDLGVESSVLIERAGSAVAKVITEKFYGGRVLVVMGDGNNGADGRVVSNILSKTHGFTVANLNVSCGIFKLLDKKFDIIVDCIFGTGLNRNIEGKYKEIIEKINKSGAFIVSCDIASGLNSDTGKVMGIAVKANVTVAIQEYKLGHFLNDGLDYSGELIAKDIGISIWEDDYVYKLNDLDIKEFFKKRNRNVNKGSFGKVAIIGGSKKYCGSVELSFSSLCALKTGAGYSFLCIPNSLYDLYALKNPECILLPFSDNDGEMSFDKDFLDKVMVFDSIAIGMGLGVNLDVYKSIDYLLKNYTGKLLIDADGLNSISKFGIEILKNKKCKVVLTPHVKEFSRLTSKEVEEIIDNPIPLAKDFAKEYDVTLLLKSSTSVITNGKIVIINSTGNSGLSKAGSGDILSGFTSGMLSRNEDVAMLTAVSSYIFGRAGEIAVKEQNEYTVTASDVINCLGKAINSL